MSKKNPRIDEELLEFLKPKFPPTEFQEGKDIDEFVNAAVFRAGQRDIIKRLEILYKQQIKDRN